MIAARPHLSRRALVAAAAFLAVPAIARGGQPAAAQDEVALATPSVPSTLPIVSTSPGEMPTTGGRRPGPAGANPLGVRAAPGVAPTGLSIAAIEVDADIEALRVVDGTMPDPTGPWVVAWYENLGALGGLGNVVMAGHIDYWNVGPSVFFDLANVQPGDVVDVFGDDGATYGYAVEWVRQYDAANAPIPDLVGPTGQESLTLFTCGGVFDYQNGRYLQRTVVRANRV